MDDVQSVQHRSHNIADGGPVYLKGSVKIEPLFCGWLTWPHLLSPVQAAMNIAFRYLPLLQSFVANPTVHVAATRDPKLLGGPFVHLALDDTRKVRELISTTKQQIGRILKLAEDVKEFDCALQSSAKGFSLNDVYSVIPQSLAGMIELVYDVNNHPRLRFIETLIYAEYGADLRKNTQAISLSNVRDRDRRFFMSTPRLKSPDVLTIATEYSNPALDSLISMRAEPIRLRELESKLGLVDLAVHYAHLFTSSPPKQNNADYVGDEVRIRYFGHACVLIQTERTSILIDPLFASDPDEHSEEVPCNRFTILSLPEKIDYLILTHCHQDHFCPEMLLQVRRRVRKVVIPANNRGSLTDPSMKLALTELGFVDVVSLEYFDTISFCDGQLTSIPFPGEHSDLDIYSKQSVFVQIKKRRLLFLVDSDGWDAALYRRIAKQIADGTGKHIDALFLGMECQGAPLTWLYGPLLSRPITRRDDESRRLSGSNYERALGIVQQFECARVYVYAMGQEPWLRYIMGLEYTEHSVQVKESDKLVSRCRSDGIISERLYGSQDIFI